MRCVPRLAAAANVNSRSRLATCGEAELRSVDVDVEPTEFDFEIHPTAALPRRTLFSLATNPPQTESAIPGYFLSESGFDSSHSPTALSNPDRLLCSQKDQELVARRFEIELSSTY